MKLPRFSVRELVLIVAIVALALALAIEHREKVKATKERDVSRKEAAVLLEIMADLDRSYQRQEREAADVK